MIAGIALAARAVAAAVLAASSWTAAPDEKVYTRLIADVARGRHRRWGTYEADVYQTRRAFIWMAALPAKLIDARLAGLLCSIGWGVANVLLVVWLANRIFGPEAALCSGLVLSLWPAQVLWSSLVLRDSAIWGCLALSAVGFFLCATGDRKHYLSGLGLLTVALLLLNDLRDESFALVVGCVVLALPFASVHRRLWRVAPAFVVVGLILPISLSHGPLAVRDYHVVENLGYSRWVNSVGSGSTLIAALPSSGSWLSPSKGFTVAAPESAKRESPPDDSLRASLAYFPKGAVAIAFRPFPWEKSRSPAFQLARLLSIPGYVLLAVGALGLWHGRLRWRGWLYTALLGAAIVVSYALTEGNLGTVVRHREDAGWALGLFAGLGLAPYVGRRFRRPGGPAVT